MEENVEREGISLTDIWKIVKKYWVGLVAIIAGTTLIGLLAAFFVVPKSYEAHENLYVMYRDKNSNPDDYMGSGDVTTSIRYVDTIATYLKSSKEHYIATEEALKAQEKAQEEANQTESSEPATTEAVNNVESNQEQVETTDENQESSKEEKTEE